MSSLLFERREGRERERERERERKREKKKAFDQVQLAKVTEF